MKEEMPKLIGEALIAIRWNKPKARQQQAAKMRAYWATISPKKRSAEFKRRAKVRLENQRRKQTEVNNGKRNED